MKQLLETENKAHKHHCAPYDNEIHFTVDGEPCELEVPKLTANEIIRRFGEKDPTTHYLVQIRHKERISYKDKGEDLISIHDCSQFQVISTGPTPVSDGTIRVGLDVFIEGLRGLAYNPMVLAGHADHVIIDYEVPTGRFAGKKVRHGFIVPPDSAWGEESHADLVRLRIGIIGAGSVGGIIAEGLVRTGFEDVMAIDFDFIEKHNLDRLIYATRDDIGKHKSDVLVEHVNITATAEHFRAESIIAAVYENEGFRAALDCDILFSCVDRPWGRYVLNLIAYAHLIPVVDGGIAVRTNKLGKLAAADWRAHTATIGRPCLQCLGQYDPGFVQLERDGYLDDPKYIAGLPKDHPLKTRENVFAFSLSCASFQMLQMLALTINPLEQPNPGNQLYHFVGGFMEEQNSLDTCRADCLFPSFAGLGDNCNIPIIGKRPISILATKNRE